MYEGIERERYGNDFQIRISDSKLRKRDSKLRISPYGGDGRWRLWRMEAATERRVFEDGGLYLDDIDTLIIIQYDSF